VDRDGWNQRYETTDLVWTAEPIRFLVAEVEGLAPGTALDVGAGEGRNAVWLAQKGGFDLVADLADSGLLVEKAECVRRPATTEAGPRVAIDALVRARRPEEP